LPPDEARERTIKGLRTRVRNLEAALQMVAGMPRETQNAIFNALHPDRKLSAAERAAEQDKALKLFTAWKADKDRAVRRGRQA